MFHQTQGVNVFWGMSLVNNWTVRLWTKMSFSLDPQLVQNLSVYSVQNLTVQNVSLFWFKTDVSKFSETTVKTMFAENYT